VRLLRIRLESDEFCAFGTQMEMLEVSKLKE
jgi:hypothetical protein